MCFYTFHNTSPSGAWKLQTFSGRSLHTSRIVVAKGKVSLFCTQCTKWTQNEEENSVFRPVPSDVSPVSTKPLVRFSLNLVWVINCRQKLTVVIIRPKWLVNIQPKFIKFLKNCLSYSTNPVHYNTHARARACVFLQQVTQYIVLGSAWWGDGSTADQKAYMVTEMENSWLWSR
jgi:hypothetical protein